MKIIILLKYKLNIKIVKYKYLKNKLIVIIEKYKNIKI